MTEISLLTPEGASLIVHKLVQLFPSRNLYVVLVLDLDPKTLVHVAYRLRAAYDTHGFYETVAQCSGYKPRHYDLYTTSGGACLGVHIYFRGDKIPSGDAEVIHVCTDEPGESDKCTVVQLDPALHLRQVPLSSFKYWISPEPVAACSKECEYYSVYGKTSDEQEEMN